MKKKFESPVMRVVKIDNTDVICTSCTNDAHGDFCRGNICDDL